jgi:hypothetical protein
MPSAPTRWVFPGEVFPGVRSRTPGNSDRGILLSLKNLLLLSVPTNCTHWVGFPRCGLVRTWNDFLPVP